MSDSAAWQIGGAIVLSTVRELAAEKSSAIIELVRGERNGHIELVRGAVVLARTGRLRETEAFNHLLLWGPEATMTAHMNPAPDSMPLQQRADTLIESGLQFLEALDELAPILGGPKSTFDPATRRVSAAAAKLPAEVERFAQLISPGAGLIDLIDMSPFRPLDTIKVCYRLCELGVLVKREPAVGGVPIEIPEEEQTTRQARFDPDSLVETSRNPAPARKPAAPPPVPALAPTAAKRPRKDPTGETTNRRPRIKSTPPKRPSRPEMIAIDTERSVRFAKFAPEPPPSPSDDTKFDAVDEAFFAGEAALHEPQEVDRFEDLENTGTRRKISKKRLF